VLRVPPWAIWTVAFVLACGALLYLANRAVYYPVKFPQGEWGAQQRIGASDVWLETEDHIRLHGWWLPSPGSRLATLFLHGNAGNVSHRAPHMGEIAAAGSSVLVLDYRGYGRSEGWPTEKGLYKDSEAGFIYLLKLGYHSRDIVLQGESLGCAVAIDLASRRPCAGLVLEAPFTSAADVAATVVPILGPVLVRGYDSIPKIRWLLMPKLFIQGDRDEVIPARLAHNLYAATQEPKSFWTVEGAGHNDILSKAGPAYRENLHSFYARLPPAMTPTNRRRKLF
jgi:uncharacterized protein